MVLWALAVMLIVFPVAAVPADHTGHLDVIELTSEQFGNRRKLRVWLPADYFDAANDTRRYPVLYLNDGQELFAESSAGAESWRVDETAAALIASGAIEPLIIVGIDNAGRSGRAYEYLPWPDEFLTPPEPMPAGNRYASFLASEVIPRIESVYRVDATKASRSLGGSSYGALIALHVAIAKPQLFGQLLLESPSFYVDDNHVLKDAARATPDVDKVYLGVGTNELGLADCPDDPGNAEAVNGVQRLAEILVAAGLPTEGLKVIVEACAVHARSAWARRLPAALRFLFASATDRLPANSL